MAGFTSPAGAALRDVVPPSVLDTQEVVRGALEHAPTLLENLLWAWLAGLSPSAEYFSELEITELRGHGNVPDEFRGEP